jgi:sensor histidine kinase YesM
MERKHVKYNNQEVFQKVNKIKKTKSIKLRLILLFVTISIVLFTGILVSMYTNNQIRNEYHQYVKKNTDLNTIPLKINEIAVRFDIMIRKKDVETIRQIHLLNDEITSILKDIQPDIQDDRDSLMHARMLVNMHEYQKNKVNELIALKELDSKSYVNVTYIKSLYQSMNSISQLLMMSYLEYSSDQYANSMEDYRKKESTINILIIAFGLFSITFAFILSKDIFLTLKEISRTAKQLADGQWHIPDIKQNEYKELDYVANAFNKMKEYIIHYIKQLNNKAEIERQLHRQKMLTIEKEKLLKESQLLNLQMQMNPHFLFNTLNMVGRTALLEDNETTIKLTESLSVMLRFNLESKGKMVPLTEELKALQAYIYIQEMRFQDRISILLNHETNIDGFFIPPMSLQPIVENCLIHGLSDNRSDGRISIGLTMQEDCAVITIHDNGKGIPPEKLQQLLTPTTNETSMEQKKTSIGLANVAKRLELSFGKENLLQIDSIVNKGTTIKIFLPKVMKRNEEIA